MKEIWKYVLESLEDKELVEIGQVLNVNIPGFRKITPQTNIKLFRPRLINASLTVSNLEGLRVYYEIKLETEDERLELRDFTVDELIEEMKDKIRPSTLFTILLSSKDVTHIEKAEEIYTILKGEDLLSLYEEKDLRKAATNEEDEKDILEENANEKVKQAEGIVKKLEKNLAKATEKNEELKKRMDDEQRRFEIEKKEWKMTKKELNQEIHELKSEMGKLINQYEELTNNVTKKELVNEEKDAELRRKEAEISRLNALCLTFQTAKEEVATSIEEDEPNVDDTSKINVAVIGDPKNTRVHRYEKFHLTIIDSGDVEAFLEDNQFKRYEEVWLLTYRSSRSVQKKVISFLDAKQLMEFRDFVDLEKYMIEG